MPHLNGYSVYIHLHDDNTHTVRLYRDNNDEHLQSWEDCNSLDNTLRDVATQVTKNATSNV
jgi:hypothetical protein